MKRILLMMSCIISIKVYAQQTLTIKTSDKGILENIHPSNSKQTKAISYNNDFPSVILDTILNLQISPLPKSTTLTKFNKFQKNIKDIVFLNNTIFKSIFPGNFSDYDLNIPKINSDILIYKESTRFPFIDFDSSKIIPNIKEKNKRYINNHLIIFNNEKYLNSFKINRQLYDNQIVINHLNNLSSNKLTAYNKDWERYRPVLDEIAQKYETWGKEIEKGDFFNGGTFNLKTVQYLDSLSSYHKSLGILFDKVKKDNEGWIKGWLWFTEGKIKLNPFDVTDPSPPMLIVDEQIQLAEDKIKLLNTYVQNRTGFSNDSFLEHEKNLERLSAGLVSLKHQKEELTTLKAKYDKWINSIKQTSVILYDGKLLTSNKSKIQWLEHYDANDKFSYKNATNTLPHSIADIDEVFTLVHNVKQGQEVSVKSTEKTVPLEPPIAIELEPFLDSFSKAFQLIPNVGKLANILKPLLGKLKDNNITTSQTGDVSFRMSIKEGDSDSGGFESMSKEKLKENFNIDDITNDITAFQKIEALVKEGKLMQADSLLKVKDGVELLSYDKIACYNSNFINKSNLKINFDSKFPIPERNESQKIQALIIDNIIAKNDRYEYFLLTTNILHCKNETDYKDVIKIDFTESKEKLSWLLNQTSPITEIKANEEPITLYRTEILYPEKELKLTTTKEITSQLSVVGNDKPIFSKTYKKYERQRFWPMGGIAIIPGLREIAIYDNDKKTFTNNPISTVEGFVGVKWFIFGKTNIDYKYQSTQLTHLGHGFNRKRGNSITNRIALNLGLGVSHQFMKNYLVGFSIDPTPGIGLNVGVNTYLQKGYELKNGNVENEFERFSKPLIYYGISLDPTIFNKLFKLF